MYLYNAARAAQRGRQHHDAQRDYALYLRNAPKSAPEHPKAMKHLAEVRAAIARAKPSVSRDPPNGSKGPPPAAKGRVSGPAAPPEQRRRAGASAIGWVLAIAGGATVVGGGYLLLGANDAQSDLDKQGQQRDASGKIIGISQADYQREQERINSSIYRGYGIAGAGLAAVGVGAYLIASSGTASTVHWTPGPTTRGVGLAWQF